MPAIKFRGVDFIDFDTLLNDDERLVRDTARKFIEENLIPIIEECNRAGRFPRELVKPMADLGFFGILIPEEYGGLGLGVTICQTGVRFLRGRRGLVSHPRFTSDAAIN